MARTFSGTATTSVATLTVTGSLAYKVYVKNTGAVALEVNVPRVHGTDFDVIASGDTEYYESKNHIGSIKVQTDSSTTTYTAAVVGGTN